MGGPCGIECIDSVYCMEHAGLNVTDNGRLGWINIDKLQELSSQ